MLAFIKGVVSQAQDGAAIIDSNGWGFRVFMPQSALSRLPRVGEPVTLFTHLHVKEDGVSLFGFLDERERRFFEMLIGVTGVGPKAALSMLSVLTPEQLVIAIASNDELSLSRAPGVGKKTAQRISLELRDKLKAEGAAGAQQGLEMASAERQDAIDALTALGYSRADSAGAVMETALADMKTEQIIRLALRKLAAR